MKATGGKIHPLQLSLDVQAEMGDEDWLVFDGGRVLARGVWEAPGQAVAVER